MSIGFWQIVVIVFVVVALFSAGRINRFFKELGKGVKSFKEEIEDTKPATQKVVPLDAVRTQKAKAGSAKAVVKKSLAKVASKSAAMKKPVAAVAPKAAPNKSSAKGSASKPAAKKATVKKAAPKKKK